MTLSWAHRGAGADSDRSDFIQASFLDSCQRGSDADCCAVGRVLTSLFRPQHALTARGNRSYAFVDEALDALAFVRFSRIQIAFRIACDAVHTVELAGLAP